MTKREMSEAILDAKRANGSSWARLAQTTGVGEVYLASCRPRREHPDGRERGPRGERPEPGARAASALLESPMKGWSMEKPIPTDPLIYRFYEIIAVYGTTLKDVIPTSSAKAS